MSAKSKSWAPTFGSLFAGIGGFDLGFESAGLRGLWQVEIDAKCRELLAAKFPRAERFGDIRECGAHNLTPVDVICGGFPNRVYATIEEVKKQLQERLPKFAADTGRLQSIAGRAWIINAISTAS